MDTIFEVLIPILIAVVYLIGGAFKGNGDEDGGGGGDAEDSAPTLSERERKIQEEIRRKIRERQQGGRTPSTPAGESAAEAPRRYDPTQSERGSRRYDPTQPETASRRTVEEQPRVRRVEAEVRRTREPERENSWGSMEQSGGFMEEMQEKRRQIREIQQRAEEMKKRAAQDMKKVAGDKKAPAATRKPRRPARRSPNALYERRGTFRDEVIAGLKDPEEFKRAILSYEILGTPVGERHQGKIGPFWEQ